MAQYAIVQIGKVPVERGPVQTRSTSISTSGVSRPDPGTRFSPRASPSSPAWRGRGGQGGRGQSGRAGGRIQSGPSVTPAPGRRLHQADSQHNSDSGHPGPASPDQHAIQPPQKRPMPDTVSPLGPSARAFHPSPQISQQQQQQQQQIHPGQQWPQQQQPQQPTPQNFESRVQHTHQQQQQLAVHVQQQMQQWRRRTGR